MRVEANAKVILQIVGVASVDKENLSMILLEVEQALNHVGCITTTPPCTCVGIRVHILEEGLKACPPLYEAPLIGVDMYEELVKQLGEEAKELVDAMETVRRKCRNDYARAYLNVIPTVFSALGKEGLARQLRYCLNNMLWWRGTEARNVKKVFGKWIEKLEEK